jgi:2-polyprenyl-3-methyl-5-hydroxy-6-metoxy-1,4-benzoquinol methylase
MKAAMIEDKSLQAIIKYVPRKKVLDVGCVGMSEKWQRHQFIKGYKPKELLGIDYNKPQIKSMKKKKRYNIEWADITDRERMEYITNKHGKFEVVIVLDTLEHIDNCGDALNGLSIVTDTGGLVVTSTPNATSYKWADQVRDTGRSNINKDHVHWFCEQTLNALFNRYGFILERRLSNKLEPRLVMIFRRI